MEIRRLLQVALVAPCIIMICDAVADEASDAKDALKEKGIRVSTSTLSLSDESLLSKQLRDVVKVRKTLLDGAKILNMGYAKLEENKSGVSKYRQQNLQLNAQLAALNPNNVTMNNKLIGLINANQSRMQLLIEQQGKMEAQLKEMRREVNEDREAYIEYVLGMRETADKIEEQYASLAADADVKAALKKLNAASDKTFAMEPSRSFQSSVKKLKSIEDKILSEKIPLKREGNSLSVSVVIDGKHTQEMVVDSGATIICLPHNVAMKCGLEPLDSDPTIQLVIADGSVIDGKLKKIGSVRVGKFTVEDVDCAVLSPVATHATCLLGMSFLGRFKFELDAQASTLTMIKVGEEEESSGSRSSRRRTGRR
jgi:clan AA aspartic protease (TIGR02281 family)